MFHVEHISIFAKQDGGHPTYLSLTSFSTNSE